MKKLSIYYFNLEVCPPVNLKNGATEYHPSSLNGQYPTDTLAFFSCDDAFMRNGPLFSTCQNTGNWVPEIPTCDEGIYIIKTLETENGSGRIAHCCSLSAVPIK